MTCSDTSSQSKNKILSPEKLSSMIRITGKGTLILILFLLMITAGIYFVLANGVVREQAEKLVYYEGEMTLDQIVKLAGDSDVVIFSEEDIRRRVNQIWGFPEGTDHFSLFTTVMTERDYEKYAPVQGSSVQVDGRITGSVILAQEVGSYDTLIEYGFSQAELNDMKVYPIDDASYCILFILSTEIDPEMKNAYYDSVLTFRSNSLKNLLVVMPGDEN